MNYTSEKETTSEPSKFCFASEHPRLIVGNPHCHRATHTRFVLPFKWSLSEGSAIDRSRPFFRRAKGDDWLHAATSTNSFDFPHLDLQRRRYVTKETESLLFENASWFVLETPQPSRRPWREFTVLSDLKTADYGPIEYSVALRTPALVLFECREDRIDSGKGAHSSYNLLHNGFLIHEAYFPDFEAAPDFADLLRFNEIFRYWRCPYPEHEDFCANELESIGKGVRSASGCDNGRPFYSAQWEELLALPLELEAGSGKVFRFIAGSIALASSTTPEHMINPDDRAFTMPFAVVNVPRIINTQEHKETNETTPQPIFQAFLPETKAISPTATPGYWVKLLNVDRPVPWGIKLLGVATDFEIRWVNDRTYKRWAHGNALYGFCEHAFAGMVPAAFDEGGNKRHGEPPVGLHFGKMYFDVTLLLLYLRVTVMRFSQSLHTITRTASRGQGGDHAQTEKWKQEFGQIRWQFLLFENLYQYPLLSNQQQHLEMYALQREWMDIKELYAEIDKEIRTSDEYLDNLLDQQRNELALVLNVVAFFGLVASLALGWMDAHSGTQSGPIYFLALWMVAFLFLIGPILISKNVARSLRGILELKRLRKALSLILILLGGAVFVQFAPKFPGLDQLFRKNPVELKEWRPPLLWPLP